MCARPPHGARGGSGSSVQTLTRQRHMRTHTTHTQLKARADVKYTPDFRTAFSHFLLHTGSKACACAYVHVRGCIRALACALACACVYVQAHARTHACIRGARTHAHTRAHTHRP